MSKLNYTQHQRDYTLTGTSVIWDELVSDRFIKFFHYQPLPNFVMVEDDTLYHFHPDIDAVIRSKNWFKYNNIKSFRLIKAEHDRNLKNYRKFLVEDYSNPKEVLSKIYYYYRLLLPIPLLVIELPEHLGKEIGEEIYDLCMQARHENEDIYKVGTDFERKVIKDLELKEKLSSGTLKYLTSFEIEQYFESGKLPEDIEQRKDFILIKHTTGVVEKYFDKEYLKKFNLVEDIDEDIKEIEGQIAFQGKVRGGVKILRKVEDIKNFKDGEIIVASMTEPRYLPAMKKAAGFVTDEGGITCHAAIIAREIKKPCIIGTKIATRVLKDGDKVEVDADKGIVKKLN